MKTPKCISCGSEITTDERRNFNDGKHTIATCTNENCKVSYRIK